MSNKLFVLFLFLLVWILGYRAYNEEKIKLEIAKNTFSVTCGTELSATILLTDLNVEMEYPAKKVEEIAEKSYTASCSCEVTRLGKVICLANVVRK